jgi:hypothetical protein
VQDLERDELVHVHVLGLVDGAHPALAEETHDAVSIPDHVVCDEGHLPGLPHHCVQEY